MKRQARQARRAGHTRGQGQAASASSWQQLQATCGVRRKRAHARHFANAPCSCQARPHRKRAHSLLLLLAFWRGHRALLPSADLHRTNWLCSERRRSGSSGMANQRLAAAAGFVQAHRWPACQPSNADNALQAAPGSLPGGPPQQLHTADRARTLGLAIVLVVGARRRKDRRKRRTGQHKNCNTPLAPRGRPERRLRNCLALVQAAPAIPQINGFHLLF